MSADNWAVCPRCMAAERARLDDLTQKIQAGYGKIPIEEFDALRVEMDAGIDTDKLRTFREDYGFYGADEGTVEVSYSGYCSKCALKFSFKDSRQFWPVKDEQQ